MAFAISPCDSGCPHLPIHPMAAECPTIFSVILITCFHLPEKMLQPCWAEEGNISNAPTGKGSLRSQSRPSSPSPNSPEVEERAPFHSPLITAVSPSEPPTYISAAARP